jgi:hypothetical protein
VIFLATVAVACAQKSAQQPGSAPVTREANATTAIELSCKEALSSEARLLAATIREDAPGSELADGLDGFAATPIVTKDTLAKFAEVRTTVRSVAAEDRVVALQRAEEAVARACSRVDGPEQHHLIGE